MQSRLSRLTDELPSRPRSVSAGRVAAARGPLIRAHLESAGVGDLCYIEKEDGSTLPAQVVSFDESGSQLAPFDTVQGVFPGSRITHTGAAPTFEFNSDFIHGLVIDCLGRKLGEDGPAKSSAESKKLSFNRTPPPPLSRQAITEQMITGVRAIDYCCPIGYGQRIGLFAGPGVGKSTLLGMISNSARVDRVVIGLIGERGREVNEFINKSLTNEGRKRAVIVVATSDESAVRRKCASYTATAIAEYYRDRGEKVLLLLDSLTRTARSIRDLSLSAGELPVRQGYTSSVFEELPRLVERTGPAARGSITAIYTVLTSFDDSLDMLSEEVKSLLDGHIALKSNIAERGIFPAIDLSTSVSRLIGDLLSESDLSAARKVVRILSRLNKDRVLALIGGRADPELKACMAIEKDLIILLGQGTKACSDTLNHGSIDFLSKKIKAIIDKYEGFLSHKI